MERRRTDVETCGFVASRSTDAWIQTYWIDYQGRLRPYASIAPSAFHDQGTYETHPWTWTTKGPKSRRCVVNDMPVYIVSVADDLDASELNQRERKAREVRIVRPSTVRWTLERHSTYGEAFKAQTRAFLLAHKRLESKELGLGRLPNDLLIEIVERFAPEVPKFRPLSTHANTSEQL